MPACSQRMPGRLSPRLSRACMRRRSEADLLPSAPARARLAYDELLANQLALAVIRARLKRRAGRRLAGTGKLRKAILAALPFKLTGAQKRALAEIDADLASPHRMLRLLQGDVGSGKTVVALLAMATCGRSRRASGADGADRAAGAAASGTPSAGSARRRACASRCSPGASAAASARRSSRR